MSRQATPRGQEAAASRKSAVIGSEDEYFAKTFQSLELAEQTVSGKIFEECTFKDCNFSGAVLKNCKFADCTFDSCNLSVLKLEESRFISVQFNGCKVVGIDWTRASWPRIPIYPQLEFRKCILNDSSFIGLKLEELVIEDCKAHEADFRDGNFSRANFKGTDFQHSLFGKTILVAADFTEAVSYDIDILDNNIQKAKFSSAEALRLLSALDIELVD